MKAWGSRTRIRKVLYSSTNGPKSSQIKELIDSLQPFKFGVEILCKRESTLITADTTFQFILEKLKNQDTVLSAELSEELRLRVKERLPGVTWMLVYLQI